jgi:hypothetical protein
LEVVGVVIREFALFPFFGVVGADPFALINEDEDAGVGTGATWEEEHAEAKKDDIIAEEPLLPFPTLCGNEDDGDDGVVGLIGVWAEEEATEAL